MRPAWGAVVFIACLVVVLPVAAALLEPASPVQSAWNALFMKVFWVAIVVGVVVYGILIYALIRFRARKGGPAEGPHIHGNTRLEIAWTIAPALVMGWLLVLSYNGLFAIDYHPDQKLDFTVGVTASQFSWSFKYPDGSTSANGTLRVEQNRVVGLDVTSTDVIHAFSSAELGVMIDAFPGKTNHFWFQATIPGTYPVRCRELCGVGHSQMLTSIFVFPQGSEGSRQWGWPPVAVPAAPSPSPGTNNTSAPASSAPVQGRAIPVSLAPGGAFRIDPAAIADVKPGETVTFQVNNADPRNVHDLRIGSFSASQPEHGAQWFTPRLAGGESANLVVTFDGDAKYEFWCDLPGHRLDFGQGMSGVLTVGQGGTLAEGPKPLLPGFEAAALAGAAAAAVLLLRRRS